MVTMKMRTRLLEADSLDRSERVKVLELISWKIDLSYNVTVGMPKASVFFSQWDGIVL